MVKQTQLFNHTASLLFGW